MTADLSNLVAVLQRKIKERDSKIMNLEEQLQAAGKAGGKQGGAESATELQQRILALETENTQLKADSSATRGGGPGATAMPVNDLVQELQRKIKKKDEEIARMKAGSKDSEGPRPSTGDHAACQQRITELSVEIQKLQDALTTEKANAANDKRVSQLEDLVKELQSSNASRDSELSLLKGNTPPPKDLSEDLARLTAEVASLTAQKRKLEENVESQVKINEKQHGEIENLTAQSNTSQKTIEDLQGQIHQKETFMQKLEDEIKVLKEGSTIGKLAKETTPPPPPEQELLKETTTKAEGSAEEITTIDAARWVCPKCGNNNRGMIREEEDKSILLNQYPPVYGKSLKCGQCGAKWHHK